jgi:hypothetical protein
LCKKWSIIYTHIYPIAVQGVLFFNSWLVFVQQGFSRTSTLFFEFSFSKRYYSWFIRFHNSIKLSNSAGDNLMYSTGTFFSFTLTAEL